MKTLAAIVLDRSSSIGDYGLQGPIIDAYNRMVDGWRSTGHDTRLTLVTFASDVKVEFSGVRIAEARALTRLNVNGSTALFDATNKAIASLREQPADKDTALLVVVVTDGEENHSLIDPRGENLRSVMRAPDLTVAFNVPKGRFKANLCRNYGVPEENVREWEQTATGAAETADASTTGFAEYTACRLAGATKVSTFYKKVTTDVTKIDLSRLDDVSARFSRATVGKEEQISTFASVHTGKPYVVGSTYYMLMKPEKVQASKGIVIAEKKARGAIYGGPQARALLGLPTDGSAARVVPGNHADYDVYVESRSYNRKLPRGTKVLIDKLKTKDETPTYVPQPQGTT